MRKKGSLSRRELMRSSAMAAGALAFTSAGAPLAGAQGSDKIRVGVVGCGNRGSGAADDCVRAAPGVEIVALADAFGDRLDGLKKKYKVPGDKCFTGLDAYKKLMALADVNLVILATPPGFRPPQLAEAIKQGKNVFMEKPVAVCPAGVKMVIEASELAAQKGLGIVAGTQRRHEPKYVETMKRVNDGQIGDVVSAQCYWNQGGLWVNRRKPGQPDVDWQIRNWLYFCWTSGDHICEQHIHNIDIVNWAFGDRMPEQIGGIGGRQYRKGDEFGNIFDHFGIDFYYPGGVQTISTCRQIDGAKDRVGERIVGTKGVATPGIGRIDGENAWSYQGPNPSGYTQEHADLIQSIRAGKPLNEGKRIAESTLTAIMARESAYARLRFKTSYFLSKCTLNLIPPDNLQLTDAKPVDPVPRPGQYKIPGTEGDSGGRRRRRG